MLCAIFNTSTLLHPSTSLWGNGRAFQVGITYTDMPSCQQAGMSTSRHVNVTARNHDDKPTGRHDVPSKLAKEEKASGDH